MKNNGILGLLIVGELGILIIAVVMSVMHTVVTAVEEPEDTAAVQTVEEVTLELDSDDPTGENADSDYTDVLASMTTEEKVAQLMIVSPEAFTGVSQVVEAGNTTKNRIDSYPVAGFLYSALNYRDDDQFNQLVANVTAYMTDRVGLAPLFVCADGTDFGSGADSVMTITGDGTNYQIGDLTASTQLENLGNGADMVIVTSDFETAYNTLLDAVNGGSISADQLDEMVSKVLALK